MEEDLNLLEMEDDSNFFLQAKASLANPGFSWAWHSSAPACSKTIVT